MPIPLRNAALLMALVASSAMTRVAAADDAVDPVRDLKQAGDDLLVAGHPIDALKYYDKALAVRRDPAILYNRGRAYNALARYPDALADLEAFEREASPELRARVPALNDFLTIVRTRVAHIRVDCDVDDALVSVAGQEQGRTPLPKPIALNAGSTALTITKDGYFPVKRVLDLTGGGTATVVVHLSPRNTSAVLHVESTTPGATVSVDGKSVGMVPAELFVTPGNTRSRCNARASFLRVARSSSRPVRPIAKTSRSRPSAPCSHAGGFGPRSASA